MADPEVLGEKIRVLLADDHALLRAGLKALLNAEPDIEVVGEAADGQEAVDLAARVRPDVIVMDIQMPVMSGLDATRALREAKDPARVLILTMHAESQYLLPLLEAGSAGYVLKSAADTELIEAIRTVHRGDVFLYPRATRLLVDGYLDHPGRSDAHDGLTEREREVLRFVAEGYSGTEIAERLGISPKTVDTYRERIMQKLGLRHRWELVRYALKKGLLRLEAESDQV